MKGFTPSLEDGVVPCRCPKIGGHAHRLSKFASPDAKYLRHKTATPSFSAGFTLIETLIYIVLLGFIMTGALLAAYQIIDGAQHMSGIDTTEQEGEFVTRKISWALAGLTDGEVLTPVAGTYGSELSLVRGDGVRVLIRRSGSRIEMSEDGGATFAPLTSANVTASELRLYTIPAGGGPSGIAVTMTINGREFSIKKYARD